VVVDAASETASVWRARAGLKLGASMSSRLSWSGHHGRRTATIAALVVAVLAPSACTSQFTQSRAAVAASQSSPGSSRAAADGHAELRLPQGLSIVAPAHSLPAGTTLSGKVTKVPVGAPQGLLLSGPTYDLRVSAAPVGSMSLTVPVPAAAPTAAGGSPRAALLAYFDPAKHTWVPVTATFDPVTSTLRAKTSHLSIWTVLVFDTKGALSAATGALKGFIGTTATADQPQCPRAEEAKTANVSAVSDTGSLVGRCLGLSRDGGPLVRVANRRGYAIEVDYPAGWSVRRVGPSDPVITQAINAVAKSLSPPAGGGQSVIVSGGETIELTAAVGTSGLVRALPSPPAYLVSGLLYGADTLAMTFGKLPGMKVDPNKTAKAITLAFAGKDCLTRMDELAHNDVSSPHAVGELFRSVTGLAVGCLGGQWEIAYGLTGALVSFVVGVLVWLADGIKLVLQGLQAAVDTAIYWRDYRIAVTTAAPVPLLGLTWAPSQEGYGTQQPTTIFNGGDPSGLVTKVHWTGWGTDRATGTGVGWSTLNAPDTAGGHYAKATVIAFKLGTCRGKRVYRAISWFFPGEGDSFDPNTYIDMCDGSYHPR
jgi:hypothetical protein